MARSAEKFLPAGFKGRKWAQGLGTDLSKDLPVISSCFEAQSWPQLLQKNANWPLVAESVRKARTPSQANLLQRATRMDFSNFMADGILVKVDRASMLNSLEVSSPLLDQRMIEFAFGKVPSRLKATPTEKKILLKRLCSRLLPPEFDLQRKQGFSMPMNVWLKGGPFRTLFDEVLRDPQCSFDAQTVNKLMRDQDKGRFNGERLFGLVMFELWRREYGISL